MKNYCLATKDQRIDFAILQGVIGSPVITVFHPDTVNEEIESCITMFFENCSFICNSSKTIYVPKFVSWYVKDFPTKLALQSFLKNFIKATDSGIVTECNLLQRTNAFSPMRVVEF